MFCKYCEKETINSRFCKYCGKEIKTIGEIIEKIKEEINSINYNRVEELLNILKKEEYNKDFIYKVEGGILFLKGDYKSAKDIFLKIKNKDWEVLFCLIISFLNEGEKEEILKYIDIFLKEKIELRNSFLFSNKYKSEKEILGEVYLYRGVLYKEENNLPEAEKSFEEAKKYLSENVLSYANLGDIYFKTDKYDKAINVYNEAINLNIDDFTKSHIYNDLGLVYFRKGLIDDAINSFKQAIILYPDNKNAIYNLGLIYVKRGISEEVKSDYKEFLKHDEGIDIVFNLSRTMTDVAKHEMFEEIDIEIIGNSEKMRKVKELIIKAAATDSIVFIQGEHGTGKELVARAIHQLSKRSGAPFIVVNCGALPESLLESELFGYEKGAFTGALKEKPGRFELADKGTVFLDEIGDVTLPMQVKLLRFVQEKEFERIGGVTTKHVDVRIISATNKDIKTLVKEGKFREDLFYRLYVVPIYMPPLRERGNDIILLAEHFLQKFSLKYEKNFKKISENVKDVFLKYSWPGNVRELENIMERIVTLFDDYEVKLEYLPEEILSGKISNQNVFNIKEKIKKDEKEYIIEILKSVNYSKTKAAKKLGISRVALWKKLKKLGI